MLNRFEGWSTTNHNHAFQKMYFRLTISHVTLIGLKFQSTMKFPSSLPSHVEIVFSVKLPFVITDSPFRVIWYPSSHKIVHDDFCE